MQMNRRALLGGLGGLVVGGSVAGLIGSVAQAAEVKKPEAQKSGDFKLTRFGEVDKPFSWQPHKLDLKEVGVVAHAGFHHQGFG